MGCYGENSIGTNYPWKCIRRSGSKIWRKLSRKNTAIYCVHRAFRREDNFRESRYSQIRVDEDDAVKLTKNIISEESRNSKEIVLEKLTDKNGKSTVNKTVEQGLSDVAEDIVSDLSQNDENLIIRKNNGETQDLAPPQTKYDKNSIDSISVGGERVIVEVQLENLKLRNDEKQEIHTGSNYEGTELTHIHDEKISKGEISQKTVDMGLLEEEKQPSPRKSEHKENDKCSLPNQMTTISLNEFPAKNVQIDCNFEKFPLTMENVETENNKCDRLEKINNNNMVETEIGTRSLPSEIKSTKNSLPNKNENKTQEQNKCATPVKIKIRVFENKRPKLSDLDVTKNEEYNEGEKETNLSLELKKPKVIDLVKLYEKQAIPSPISKITTVKTHTSIRNIREENSKIGIFGPNECGSIPSTVSTLSNPKRKNLSKEYDLIEYSSFRLESLMTKSDDSSSAYLQKSNSDIRTPVRVNKLKNTQKQSPERVPIEANFVLRKKNSVTINTPERYDTIAAEATEQKKKYQFMLAWMWTWMF